MEVWKQIPEWPEYEVSNMGNVVSNRSGVRVPIKQRWINSGKRGGVYKGFKVRDGTKLPTGNPKTTTIKTHRIVALLFIGEPPAGKPIVMHLDDNKEDNTVNNLAYGTHKENMELAKKNRMGRIQRMPVYT